MAISKRKLAANRANAQKSTGPKSVAGKEKVSQNAVKHALCGRFTVLSCEKQQDYNDLLHRFMQTEQPADDVERELVAKMARHTWSSERAQRLQDACLLVQPRSGDDIEKGLTGIAVRSDLEMHMRYQSHHDRAYQRASNELAKRRKQRELAARGLASQKRAESQQELREAEEKRRERRHEQREERHKTAVALDNKYLDLAHTKLIQASHDVAELFTGLSSDEISKFAA